MKKEMTMRRNIITLLLAVMTAMTAEAKVDTLRISSAYTTHIIFSTDLTYADLSNSRFVVAKIIEQNKNMLALKAKESFSGSCSVSALESNGTMHTFIVVYKQFPPELVIDMRKRNPLAEDGPSYSDRSVGGAAGAYAASASRSGDNVSTWKTGSAPVLKDVISYPQRLYHIGEKDYDIQVMCEDIFAYSDITYIILSLKNNSGISYNINEASFTREMKSKRSRKLTNEGPVLPRSRYGNLSAGPGASSRIVYSFDKLSLYKNQVLKVYFYEEGGQRNLTLTISAEDINKARSAMDK